MAFSRRKEDNTRLDMLWTLLIIQRIVSFPPRKPRAHHLERCQRANAINWKAIMTLPEYLLGLSAYDYSVLLATVLAIKVWTRREETLQSQWTNL